MIAGQHAMHEAVARLDQANATENAAWVRLFYAPDGSVETTLGDLAPNW